MTLPFSCKYSISEFEGVLAPGLFAWNPTQTGDLEKENPSGALRLQAQKAPTHQPGGRKISYDDVAKLDRPRPQRRV